MHEECAVDHGSEAVDVEGDEFEEIPETDPSSDRSPSPVAVISSESQSNNLTFQLNASLGAQKEQNGDKKSLSDVWSRYPLPSEVLRCRYN